MPQHRRSSIIFAALFLALSGHAAAQSPAPTPSPLSEFTLAPTPAPLPEFTLAPTPAPLPEFTLAPTRALLPEFTLAPTPAPLPEFTLAPTPARLPEFTLAPTPASNESPAPTPSPLPEFTLAPTPAPLPEFTLEPTPASNACEVDTDCDTGNGEACCLLTNTCEAARDVAAGACGDPHMTGFRGQKFDFIGIDDGWYAVVSDLPYVHINMRITSPVPSVPEITHITGTSVITTDANDLDHTIIVLVRDPHSLESSCPVGRSLCLADGALHVVVDGEEVLLAPGEVILAPDVAVAAVNPPGACRSFGFEEYWERKKLELVSQAGRKLSFTNTMQDMFDWVLSDPTATNPVECAEYVAAATAIGGVVMFAHQSEHASFQIMTPTAKIRLSHGRLHQLPMRDPTDQFDLPDHLTWQMNMAIDYGDMSLDTTGILGETLVPTVDANGFPILQGMEAIRGTQEDYRVDGPLGVMFSQTKRHEKIDTRGSTPSDLRGIYRTPRSIMD